MAKVCKFSYTTLPFCCLKKNQKAPRPSEHPPVREEKLSERHHRNMVLARRKKKCISVGF